jgi:small subunit ribosomal protein S2
MAEYIFGARSGLHIIDLEKTLVRLEDAMNYVTSLVARGGTVLFLGTKNQAKDVIEKSAIDCGMPYVTTRWLGGTLTNYGEVMNTVKRYNELVTMKENGEMAKRYTKKEQSRFGRQIKDAESKIGGIKTLTRLPDAIFIIDVMHEKTALLEANTRKIPVIALSDTNVNPNLIAYPIPSNDDAVKTIALMTKCIAEAVKEGAKLRDTRLAEEAKAREAMPRVSVAPLVRPLHAPMAARPMMARPMAAPAAVPAPVVAPAPVAAPAKAEEPTEEPAA